MNAPAQKPPAQSELRVVVDAQIALSMFLIRRNRQGASSPKQRLLGLLVNSAFHWLWTPESIADYERGANAVETNERLRRHTEFDRLGFRLLLGTLQLSPPVSISAGTLRNARNRLSQAPRIAERDLDDAVYLACAVDGYAHLLVSEDSDLLSLGSMYEATRIVSWRQLTEELSELGL